MLSDHPRAAPRRHTYRPSRQRALHGLALACALAGTALAAACATPEPDPDHAAVAAALDSAYAAFSQAYARANVQLLMDRVYAPDGYYMPPDSPILHGQDEFRGQFSFLERYARTDQPGPVITFDVVDRDVSGDLAYDIGIYTLRAPDQSEEQATRGKFLIVWKRVRGAWRIWADSYSPMAAPTAP